MTAIDDRTGLAARDTVESVAAHLAVALGGVVKVFYPERIVLGGWTGSLLGDRLVAAVRRTIPEHALRLSVSSVEVGDCVAEPIATASRPRSRGQSGALIAPPGGNRPQPSIYAINRANRRRNPQ
jgi:predicted NBD/HSP70 family sugar kinase